MAVVRFVFVFIHREILIIKTTFQVDYTNTIVLVIFRFSIIIPCVSSAILNCHLVARLLKAYPIPSFMTIPYLLQLKSDRQTELQGCFQGVSVWSLF